VSLRIICRYISQFTTFRFSVKYLVIQNTGRSNVGISDYLQIVMNVLFPLGALGETFIMIQRNPKISDYLNNWTAFEATMAESFSGQKHIFDSVKNFRNVVLTILVITLLTTYIFVFISSDINSEMTIKSTSRSFTTFSYILFGAALTIMFTSDAESTFMIRITGEAFRQVKKLN
jgi:hypothetical protein